MTALDGQGARLAKSGDIASTIAFSHIVARQTEVSATHADELLRAHNGVRTAAGWAHVTWESILPPASGVPLAGGFVTARHVAAIRARLNEAVHFLGVPLAGYTDPDLNGVIIRRFT